MRTTRWTQIVRVRGGIAVGPLQTGRLGTVAAAIVTCCLLAGPLAEAQERPRTSSSVEVPAQGGGSGGVQPVAGAPPVVAPGQASGPVAATAAPGPRQAASRAARATSLRAVALAEGEATVEVGGVREVVRPGSRLGGDRVRAVAPGRIVLERPAPEGEPGGPALVIVTFDETGRAKERVFWTRDPARPAEVKRP